LSQLVAKKDSPVREGIRPGTSLHQSMENLVL
jgi:hypothetical protein